MIKTISYDKESKDFAMYLNSELIGYARTYLEAETTLNQLVYELLSVGFTPAPAVAEQLQPAVEQDIPVVDAIAAAYIEAHEQGDRAERIALAASLPKSWVAAVGLAIGRLERAMGGERVSPWRHVATLMVLCIEAQQQVGEEVALPSAARLAELEDAQDCEDAVAAYALGLVEAQGEDRVLIASEVPPALVEDVAYEILGMTLAIGGGVDGVRREARRVARWIAQQRPGNAGAMVLVMPQPKLPAAPAMALAG